jgi:hypothetical protein
MNDPELSDPTPPALPFEEPAKIDLAPYLNAVEDLRQRVLSARKQVVDHCPCGDLGRRIDARGVKLLIDLEFAPKQMEYSASADEPEHGKKNLDKGLERWDELVSIFEDWAQDATDLPEDENDAQARVVIALEDVARSLGMLARREVH